MAQITSGSPTDEMSNIARYKNGHLFSLAGTRTPLTDKLATALGGLDQADFDDFEQFKRRME